MKKNKLNAVAALVLSGSLLLASSASAFNDVHGQDAKITESLQQKGVIQGISKDKFVPKGKLTGAQGVYMIVQALGLEGKEGKEGKKNSNKHHGKNSWYYSAQKALEDRGIKLPDKFKWNGEISKEQFAYILDQAISSTGNYPMIKMYIDVKDADQGNVLYSGSIQRLLLMKITELDDKGKFYPTSPLTRIEAARMVYNAAEYVKEFKENEEKNRQNVSVSVERINDQVNKVTLTRYQQPHPGYGIRVAKVEFTKQNKAIVYYELLSPDPDMMYPQVITDSKTETYVSNQYTVEIEQLK